MAIKKSELYSSLWASADELRGGMDASQYKDYVLTLLFVKYISDKYKGQKFAAITIPEGASFDDMVQLIGNPEVGDKVNKQILNPIKEANRLNDFPDFNDENKLGKGKDLVDTVSNLIRIFNDPQLDFSKNSAEGDDILGDAYEYLMRHFATESGKSKGQFYTPAEVSRVLAKAIGINEKNATRQTTVYDPACGSGSLLLKVAAEAGTAISIFGQEKENTTANLAKMNMILHNSPTAEIIADNTLSRPFYRENDGSLKKFDYVVANPPFSLKNWSNGVNTENDEFDRFNLGVPPEKNGDYAFLLHIIKSMKSTAKAAVVLPHGVLFRGHSEGEIRKNIIKKGYIKGIIGLPANLFYGTGIPACVVVLDKENAADRKAIFMMDASQGFVKDGNKNRLREQDIRKITDVFSAQSEIPKYSRLVPIEEIADEKNEYNLNIPRYIDTQEEEDLQNIEAHLHGGIPAADIEGMAKYWKVFPGLKQSLFEEVRPGFFSLKGETGKLKEEIFNHPEFSAYNQKTKENFNDWLNAEAYKWEKTDKGVRPKQLIGEAGEGLLKTFEANPLTDAYDMYQHLRQYWSDQMQDDVYSVSMDGWEAGRDFERLMIKGKRGKDGRPGKEKAVPGLAGVEGRMIPVDLMAELFFKELKTEIELAVEVQENAKSRMQEIEEEESGEEGVFGELDKVNATEVKKLLNELKSELKKEAKVVSLRTSIAEATEDRVPYGNETQRTAETVEDYLKADEDRKAAAKKQKELEAKLEKEVLAKYPKLTEAEIKDAVINRKWKATLSATLEREQERISQNLTQRIKELAERYEDTLVSLEEEAAQADEKVKQHLKAMGF